MGFLGHVKTVCKTSWGAIAAEPHKVVLHEEDGIVLKGRFGRERDCMNKVKMEWSGWEESERNFKKMTEPGK